MMQIAVSPPMLPQRNFFDLTKIEVEEWITALGEPRYRSDQVLRWVYQEGAQTYEQMSNLPKALRARMVEEVSIYASTVLRSQTSSDGTIKCLLQWPDA